MLAIGCMRLSTDPGRDDARSLAVLHAALDAGVTLLGTIESVIPSDAGGNAWYVVRFDSPLELQESGAATPSGFILRRCSHCVIRSRWQGTDIDADGPVSVHVRLVPPGSEPPRRSADIVGLPIRVWARCVVSGGRPGRQRKL